MGLNGNLIYHFDPVFKQCFLMPNDTLLFSGTHWHNAGKNQQKRKTDDRESFHISFLQMDK